MKSIFLFLFLIPTTAFGKEVFEYEWLTAGDISGSQVVEYENNKVTIKFEFSDRGLGPKLVDNISLSESGIIVHQELSGNSFMGVTVNERFSMSNKTATWKNDMESESRELPHDNYFYIAANPTPQGLELLISAIKKTGSKSISLLPSGVATLETLTSYEINLLNEKKTVTLYAISGLGYTPDYVWLDEDARLFALPYGSMGMIRKGWSQHLEKLQSMQDKFFSRHMETASKKMTEKLPEMTVINNVNIFDSLDSKVKKNMQVVIKNGRVYEINTERKAFADAKQIDGTDRTLMAGLWDMHVHTAIEDGLFNIASGVTNVRDVGSVYKELIDIKNSFENNRVIGPNIYPVGLIDKKTDSSAPSGRLVESLDEAIEAVDWYFEKGYTQIKLYSSIEPEWIKPISDHARSKNMRVSGHIPALTNAEYAVKNGFNEIHHMNMVFRNFVLDEGEDYRGSAFALVGERGGKLDLASKEVTEFLSLLKDNNVVVDPTLAIFHTLYLNKSGEIDPNFLAIADNLPVNVVRDYLLSPALEINSQNELLYLETTIALRKMTKLMYDAGITIVAGTDFMAGFSLHSEMALLVKAGIPITDVLKIVTITAAKLNGEHQRGFIKVGNHADMILIDGDPTQDINDIRNVSLVFKDVNMYSTSVLFKSVGVTPFIQ